MSAPDEKHIVFDQLGRVVRVPEHPQRIISLVPSQTELLHDLGLGDRVVGITKFCVHPVEWFRSKARVGGTKKVDIDKVRALKPDLIIGNKEENERTDIEALKKEFPVWMSDVRDLKDATDMITRIGSITGTEDGTTRMIKHIDQAFNGLKPVSPALSAAYFIWQDPLMVAGGDTFINDMMRHCGLVNVFTSRPGRYVEVTARELAAADPDVILLSSEPFPFAEKHIAQFNMFCPGSPVRLVDGTYFSWYGSRLMHAPSYFRSLLEEMIPSGGHP